MLKNDLFKNIDLLIDEKFPDDKIIDTSKVFFLSSLSIKVKKIPFAFDFRLPLPLPSVLIETNNRYIVDERASSILNSGILGNVLSSSIFYYLIFFLFHPNQVYLSSVIYLLIVLGVINLVLDLIFIKSFVHVIDKRWIKINEKKGNKFLFQGVIPENSFFTLYDKKIGATSYTGITNIPFKYTFFKPL